MRIAGKVIDATATIWGESEGARAAVYRSASGRTPGRQAAIADRLKARPRVTHMLPIELEANEMLASMSKLFRRFGAGDPT